jgi:hypothetical protein
VLLSNNNVPCGIVTSFVLDAACCAPEYAFASALAAVAPATQGLLLFCDASTTDSH